MINYRRIFAILKKEFIQLKRDITTMRMIVTIPIIQLILFGFAINTSPKHLPTAVNLQEKSVLSRNILSGMQNSKYFSVNYFIDSDKIGKNLLDQGLVTFVVTIPNDFSKQLIRGQNPQLLVESDATDPMAVSGALPAFNEITATAIKKIAKGPLSFLNKQEKPLIINHKLYNPEGLTRYNIVPGLIAIVLTMTCVMMTAISLTKERERGTMENLLSMPVTPIEVMAGKIAPYILIGYIQAGIILLSAKFIFGVPILGNIFLLCFALLIFIICNLSLGFTLSTVSENQMQAMQGSIFVLLPSILLSGFMFPFAGMPNWAQFIGNLLPSTYFIRIVRGIMLKGNTWSDIFPSTWPLIFFMFIVTIITVKAYKKTLD